MLIPSGPFQNDLFQNLRTDSCISPPCIVTDFTVTAEAGERPRSRLGPPGKQRQISEDQTKEKLPNHNRADLCLRVA
ncbi:hypothetical protein SKAU_G00355590 [Synaphobranchus kaupii]|uniref:Uncharacterized protein n=1 Tax=Synaphobranchus kaupii TaxID=118154 RepID=A0A9Q1IEF6_SYNKA|nr:hypothetical protein SKAU_G00355590 [Synaphobranchus kaupii]